MRTYLLFSFFVFSLLWEIHVPYQEADNFSKLVLLFINATHYTQTPFILFTQEVPLTKLGLLVLANPAGFGWHYLMKSYILCAEPGSLKIHLINISHQEYIVTCIWIFILITAFLDSQQVTANDRLYENFLLLELLIDFKSALSVLWLSHKKKFNHNFVSLSL